MCIILVANIYGASATQYVRPFLQISPFSSVVADVSSQFSSSQLCNMIVLAARLIGTLFGHQIVFSMRKKWSRRTRQALRSITSNSKQSYQPQNAKKISCHRYLKKLFHGFTLSTIVLYSINFVYNSGQKIKMFRFFRREI